MLIGQWEWSPHQLYYLWCGVQHARGRGESLSCLVELTSLLGRAIMPPAPTFNKPSAIVMKVGLPLWMRNIACHISKQRMLQPSSHHIAASLMVEPWGHSRWKQVAHHQAVSCCSQPPPPWCTLWRLRMRTHRVLAPDSWGAYQRNDFHEPRLLHLSIHRKVLYPSTWDIWFSLINSNLLMFLLPALCCKNSYISWLPRLSLLSSPSELSEILCPGLKSSALSAE